MHPLDRKLFRDLGRMKGQVAAIAVVMACGLAMMIMALSLVLSLETAKEAYYASHRLADIFCHLKRAPNAMRARLNELPGATAVETRVTGSAILDLPGMRETANATLLSIPDDRAQQLNFIFLRSGRFPQTGGRNEVLVGEAFAQAHGFKPGDELDAILYGGRERLRIVGIALSPEFVFELPPGTIVPDDRRFGVFWMNERELAAALGLNGAFNNVLVDLAPGADPRLTMAELNRLLEPWGGLAAYGRQDHLSAKQVDDRIRVLRGFAVAFPALFLSVAAFMTSAALTRLVHLQREQIAQLKAFGYSSMAVGWHYLKFALVMVMAATLGGTIVGFWLGSEVVILYRQFFRFPSLLFHPNWLALVFALAASSATSFLGVLSAVRQAMKLPPAEAMRPAPPAEFRPSALERMGLQKRVSPVFLMALRNLERKPWQAFFTALGLALAAAIPIIPGAMRDGITYLMEFQWRLAQQQDVTLGLIEPGPFKAFSEMGQLPGVLRVEPFRSVPARLRHAHRENRIGITGLPRETHLNRLLNERGEPVVLPLAGMLLSSKLAEMMGLQPGDSVRIEVQEGRRPILETVVAGTITDFAGVGAYMEINALRRLLREGAAISGAHLQVDPAQWERFLAQVKKAPLIASINPTQAARESFQKTTGDMMGIVQGIYFMFAVIVSFGVVYNGARIALSERTRDLATLRVIGFTHREIASILIGELVLLTLLALPAGLWIGSELASLLVKAASTETVRIPLVLTSRTYGTAVVIILISSGLSFSAVSRRLRDLDLVGVLKTVE